MVKNMRMVIVGAGVWVWPGIKLTNNDEETELIIFTKSEDIAYSSCAVPLVLGGNIKSFDDIISMMQSIIWRKICNCICPLQSLP